MADSSERAEEARRLLERLLEAAKLHRATGSAYLRIDLNQGGVTNAKAELTLAVKAG